MLSSPAVIRQNKTKPSTVRGRVSTANTVLRRARGGLRGIPGRVLEVGCGRRCFIRAIAAQGSGVQGHIYLGWLAQRRGSP